MQNEIESIPVFLLLKKIFLENLSGKLLVKYNKTIKTLYIKQGYLVSVRSNVFDDRIGVILYLLEKIDVAQYDFFSGLIHSPDDEVVRILINNNLVSKEDLSTAMNYQKRSIVLSTFSVSEGIWQFSESEVLPVEEYHYPIPLSSLLYQGGREDAVTHFFKRRFYFHCPIPRQIPQTLKHLFTDGEIQLLTALGRKPNLSCIEAMDKCKWQAAPFWQVMSVFWLLDILAFEKKKLSTKAKPKEEKPLIYKFKATQPSANPQEAAEEAGLEKRLAEAEDFYQNRKYDSALIMLKELMKEAPRNGQIYYYLALCQSNLEFFKSEAEHNFKKAIELEPWNPEISYSLGLFFRDNNNPKLAEKCFHRTLHLNPNYLKAAKALKEMWEAPKKGDKSRKKGDSKKP